MSAGLTDEHEVKFLRAVGPEHQDALDVTRTARSRDKESMLGIWAPCLASI